MKRFLTLCALLLTTCATPSQNEEIKPTKYIQQAEKEQDREFAAKEFLKKNVYELNIKAGFFNFSIGKVCLEIKEKKIGTDTLYRVELSSIINSKYQGILGYKSSRSSAQGWQKKKEFTTSYANEEAIDTDGNKKSSIFAYDLEHRIITKYTKTYKNRNTTPSTITSKKFKKIPEDTNNPLMCLASLISREYGNTPGKIKIGHVLGKDGKAHPFEAVYTGKTVSFEDDGSVIGKGVKLIFYMIRKGGKQVINHRKIRISYKGMKGYLKLK